MSEQQEQNDITNDTNPSTGKPADLHVPKTIQNVLYGVFLWCLLGIALAYGMRLWSDAPVHPSFIPFVGIAFSAILSFAVVMAFRTVSGEVDFEFGSMKLKGASGPVLFWSICFLAISYGMYLLGITDVVQKEAATGYKSCSALDIARGECKLYEHTKDEKQDEQDKPDIKKTSESPSK